MGVARAVDRQALRAALTYIRAVSLVLAPSTLRLEVAEEVMFERWPPWHGTIPRSVGKPFECLRRLVSNEKEKKKERKKVVIKVTITLRSPHRLPLGYRARVPRMLKLRTDPKKII